MKQMQFPGVAIEECSDRGQEIMIDIEDILNMIARCHSFTWTAPIHDIVRRLMNEVAEFKPAGGDQQNG